MHHISGTYNFSSSPLTLKGVKHVDVWSVQPINGYSIRKRTENACH